MHITSYRIETTIGSRTSTLCAPSIQERGSRAKETSLQGHGATSTARRKRHRYRGGEKGSPAHLRTKIIPNETRGGQKTQKEGGKHMDVHISQIYDCTSTQAHRHTNTWKNRQQRHESIHTYTPKKTGSAIRAYEKRPTSTMRRAVQHKNAGEEVTQTCLIGSHGVACLHPRTYCFWGRIQRESHDAPPKWMW